MGRTRSGVFQRWRDEGEGKFAFSRGVDYVYYLSLLELLAMLALLILYTTQG